MKRWKVGIFIFDGVEVLDFAGPFEVFSRTRLTPGLESRRSDDSAPFEVFTVAAKKTEVTATGGLILRPAYGFAEAPTIDLLVIPGGFGVRTLLEDEGVLDWIRSCSRKAGVTTSVCTGSLLLAKSGLLEGREATTHWGSLDLLAQLDTTIHVNRTARFVDDEIITSAGVASGMDMAFLVVEKLFGREVADETASYIEFRRS